MSLKPGDLVRSIRGHHKDKQGKVIKRADVMSLPYGTDERGKEFEWSYIINVQYEDGFNDTIWESWLELLSDSFPYDIDS